MRITLALCAMLAVALAAVPFLAAPVAAESDLTEGLPVVEAEAGTVVHLRQGPCALISLEGAWTTQEMDGVWCSWPDEESARAVVLKLDGEVVVYEMTLDGEVLDGPDWLSIRPCDAVGPEGNTPWEDGWDFAVMPSSPCSPVVQDFPRGALVAITFSGDCWETPTSSGTCDTEKTCTADKSGGCTLTWSLVNHVKYSESSECGGDLVVQFYCDATGTPRVRVCS